MRAPASGKRRVNLPARARARHLRRYAVGHPFLPLLRPSVAEWKRIGRTISPSEKKCDGHGQVCQEPLRVRRRGDGQVSALRRGQRRLRGRCKGEGGRDDGLSILRAVQLRAVRTQGIRRRGRRRSEQGKH